MAQGYTQEYTAGVSLDLDDLVDVTVTSVADNEILAYDSSSGLWINQTAAEAALATSTHNHDTSYVSIVGSPTADNFASLTAGGEIQDSGHKDADYADATHTHTVYFTFCMSGALVTSDDTGAFRLYLPHAMTITKCGASVGTAPTGAAIIVDVHKDGTTIFTTTANRPEIAVSGFWSGWETPDVTAFAADSYLTVNIDQVGSTVAGANLTVIVYATRSA